jgi:hypothetical protein
MAQTLSELQSRCVPLGMKVERKLSDFFAEKWKRNENMKMKTEFLQNGNGNGNSLAEVETEMEWCFSVEQMRKR